MNASEVAQILYNMQVRAHPTVTAETKKITGAFNQVGNSFDRVAMKSKRLPVAIGSIIGAEALRRTILFTDQYRVLEQRIKTATSATGDFGSAYKRLAGISLSTGSALATNVKLFQSLARAAPELGATNAQMLRMTEAVTRMGVIGGSSVEAMRFGLLQLSQGMASGILRAEEMNSILENIPEIANRMAIGMGKTTGALRRAVLAGKVSSKQVFDSIMSQADSVAQQFKNIAPSIARSWQGFKDASGIFLSNLDKALPITQNIAKALDKASGAMKSAVFGNDNQGNRDSTYLKAEQDLQKFTPFANKDFKTKADSISNMAHYYKVFDDPNLSPKQDFFKPQTTYDTQLAVAKDNYWQKREKEYAERENPLLKILGTTDITKIESNLVLRLSTLNDQVKGFENDIRQAREWSPHTLKEHTDNLTRLTEEQTFLQNLTKKLNISTNPGQTMNAPGGKYLAKATTSNMEDEAQKKLDIIKTDVNKYLTTLNDLKGIEYEYLKNWQPPNTPGIDPSKVDTNTLGGGKGAAKKPTKNTWWYADLFEPQHEKLLKERANREAINQKVYDEKMSPFKSLKDNLQGQLTNIDSKFGDNSLQRLAKRADAMNNFHEEMKTLEIQHQTSIVDIQREFEDTKLNIEEEYARKKLEINSKFNEQKEAQQAFFGGKFVDQDWERPVQQQAAMFDAMMANAAQHSKEMFEINKYLSIAKAAYKAPEAILNSYAFGTSIGGPVLGAVFAGMATAATAIQIAAMKGATYQGGRAMGGPVSASSMYEVAEGGYPEILSMNNRNYLLTGNKSGYITPSSAIENKGNFGTPVVNKINVIVHNNGNIKSEVTQTPNSNGGMDININNIIDQRVSDGVLNADSPIGKSLAMRDQG